jgi:glutamate racemase
LHKHSSPIGVFDSGIGGLSVLRHLRQLLPNESFIYFADSDYAPYGDKTEEEIQERSLKITQFLISKNIKALVVACNTATAAAIKMLRQQFPELIIIGIEPGLKPAALQSKTKKIGVLATRSTMQSQKFNQLRDQLEQEIQVKFFTQACVGLVNLIEQGDIESEDMTQLLHQYVEPLIVQGVDAIVLGCTHYPFVLKQIEQIIKIKASNVQDDIQPTIQLIDTGLAVAKQLKTQLTQNSLLAKKDEINHEKNQGQISLWNTKQNANDILKINKLIPELDNHLFTTIAI